MVFAQEANQVHAHSAQTLTINWHLVDFVPSNGLCLSITHVKDLSAIMQAAERARGQSRALRSVAKAWRYVIHGSPQFVPATISVIVMLHPGLWYYL